MLAHLASFLVQSVLFGAAIVALLAVFRTRRHTGDLVDVTNAARATTRPDTTRAADVAVAAAAVALVGYVFFWGWLWSARLGQVTTVAGWVAVGAMLVAGRRSVLAVLRDRDVALPLVLAVTIGLLHIGSLHLYASDYDVAKLAANRFIAALPVDNEIPWLFAERLLHGNSPRQLIGDWLSSDRPPLQTGVILLGAPILQFLGLPLATGAQAAGNWFQLLWVPAGWALIRTIGLAPRAAAAVLAVVGLSGQTIIHGLYVWPKLAAAALVVTVFVVGWGFGRGTPRRLALAGAAAALAWLAHGGAAFSLLALGLLGLFWRRPSVPAIAAGALAFAVVAAPWLAYQAFYEPPGNRLLKWHLAGVIPPDERGFAETWLEAYRELPAAQVRQNKTANFRYLAQASPTEWFRFAPQQAETRRVADFFQLFHAFGLWTLGWLLLPWLAWRNRAAALLPAILLGWTALTILLWALLLFGPNYTMIHQGSLAVPLVFLLGSGVVCWQLHPRLWLALAAWQLAQFLFTWLPRSHRISDSIQGAAAAAVVIGLVGLGWFVWRAFASASPAGPAQDGTCPAGDGATPFHVPR